MSIADILTYIPISILILTLFWLSNREMRKTLELTKASERMLAIDRDTLQIKMDEKTNELKGNRIARMNELAKAAEFGRLSQGLFHELITPLTSMVLHAEKNHDMKIKEASDRMSAYIDDIRSTLSREETERECVLKEELRNVLRLLAFRIRNQNVEISIQETIMKGLGSCAWHGNPIKIRQIFSNLISNAIDSFDDIKSKNKKIEIELIQNQNKNIIRIKDNGCGIEEGKIEKIFDAFFTTKAPGKGTGIGLTTVKSIVEKDLKGMIGVKSDGKNGTLFEIVFPK